MAIICQFFLSVGSALSYLYHQHFGPQTELNRKADLLDPETERAKLVKA